MEPSVSYYSLPVCVLALVMKLGYPIFHIKSWLSWFNLQLSFRLRTLGRPSQGLVRLKVRIVYTMTCTGLCLLMGRCWVPMTSWRSSWPGMSHWRSQTSMARQLFIARYVGRSLIMPRSIMDIYVCILRITYGSVVSYLICFSFKVFNLIKHTMRCGRYNHISLVSTIRAIIGL